jgi:hypothetical protein
MEYVDVVFSSVEYIIPFLALVRISFAVFCVLTRVLYGCLLHIVGTVLSKKIAYLISQFFKHLSTYYYFLSQFLTAPMPKDEALPQNYTPRHRKTI